MLGDLRGYQVVIMLNKDVFLDVLVGVIQITNKEAYWFEDFIRSLRVWTIFKKIRG